MSWITILTVVSQWVLILPMLNVPSEFLTTWLLAFDKIGTAARKPFLRFAQTPLQKKNYSKINILYCGSGEGTQRSFLASEIRKRRNALLFLHPVWLFSPPLMTTRRFIA